MKTALYRHFSADGRLLYVGISLNTVQRTAQHRNGAHWFRDIARIDIEWLPERASALASEAVAIATENPLWNLARPAYSGPEPLAQLEPAQRQMEVPEGSLRPGWAVIDRESKAADGWYFDGDGAVDMLAHWRGQFPLRQFVLIERSGFERWSLRDGLWLADECLKWRRE